MTKNRLRAMPVTLYAPSLSLETWCKWQVRVENEIFSTTCFGNKIEWKTYGTKGGVFKNWAKFWMSQSECIQNQKITHSVS